MFRRFELCLPAFAWAGVSEDNLLPLQSWSQYPEYQETPFAGQQQGARPEGPPGARPEGPPGARPEGPPGARPEGPPGARPEGPPGARPEGPPGARPEGPPGARPEGPPGARPEGPPGARPEGPPGARPEGPPGARPEGPPGARPEGPPGARPEGPPGARPEGPPGASNEASTGELPGEPPEAPCEEPPEAQLEGSGGRSQRHPARHPGRHFGNEMFGRGWGDEHRNRRGDIKFILLELLSEHPSHGYDLIKEMETRYGGFRRLSPGSVYPTLQLLEESGYLRSAQEGGKRIYTITEEGRLLLAERAQQETPDSPGDSFKTFMTGKSQEFIELRNTATELAAILVQVARSGNVERINRVRELLDQVKRDIYAIMAEK